MPMTISLRPGASLAPKIAKLSESWGVSPCQVTKRLASLAVNGLSVLDHQPVKETAAKLGVSYPNACVFFAALGGK